MKSLSFPLTQPNQQLKFTSRLPQPGPEDVARAVCNSLYDIYYGPARVEKQISFRDDLLEGTLRGLPVDQMDFTVRRSSLDDEKPIVDVASTRRTFASFSLPGESDIVLLAALGNFFNLAGVVMTYHTRLRELGDDLKRLGPVTEHAVKKGITRIEDVV